MPDWINHKLKSGFLGEISTISYMQKIPYQKGVEKLKSLLIRVKGESEKAGLKLSIKISKIMASGHITPRQIEGKTWKQ